MNLKNMYISVAGVKRHTTVNGPGVRYVVFMQGCEHRCPGCHNPETHDIRGGTEFLVSDLIKDILETKYIDGITLSGGDPLMQAAQSREIARVAKSEGMNVWLYTGFTFEEIIEGKAGDAAREALGFIDVLVDGKFVAELRSDEAIWRGSSNQRLVDVPKSLSSGRLVEFNGQFEL